MIEKRGVWVSTVEKKTDRPKERSRDQTQDSRKGKDQLRTSSRRTEHVGKKSK